MMAAIAWRPSGRYPSPHSRPSTCIAFTISNAIGKLVIVAACCDIGVLRCGLLEEATGEYPFSVPDTEIDTSPTAHEHWPDLARPRILLVRGDVISSSCHSSKERLMGSKRT